MRFLLLLLLLLLLLPPLLPLVVIVVIVLVLVVECLCAKHGVSSSFQTRINNIALQRETSRANTARIRSLQTHRQTLQRGQQISLHDLSTKPQIQRPALTQKQSLLRLQQRATRATSHTTTHGPEPDALFLRDEGQKSFHIEKTN